jgi:hypothetical protein
MLKNDDQQLLDPRVMGVAVSTLKQCKQECYHPSKWRNATWLKNWAPAPGETRPPWVIGRPTNRGDIRVSPGLTWAELALLRLLTRSPSATEMPNYGNPPGAEFGGNPYQRTKWKRSRLKAWARALVGAPSTRRARPSGPS